MSRSGFPTLDPAKESTGEAWRIALVGSGRSPNRELLHAGLNLAQHVIYAVIDETGTY